MPRKGGAVDDRGETRGRGFGGQSRLGRDQHLEGDVAQFHEAFPGEAHAVQQRFRRFCGGLALAHADRGTALNPGAMKQALGRWHGLECARFRATARLAEYHDGVGIAAEIFDVVADPFEGGDKVEHPRDAGLGVFARRAQIGQMEIAEDAESVIDGHAYDVFVAGLIFSVEAFVVARAAGESAPVKAHEDWPLGAVVDAGSPHVKHETVFALAAGMVVPADGVDVVDTARGRGLWRDVSPLCSVFDASPGGRLGRRKKAVFAAGVAAIVNAFEYVDAVDGGSAYLAVSRFDHG